MKNVKKSFWDAVKKYLHYAIIPAGLVFGILFSLTYVGKFFHLKVYDLYSNIKAKPAEWDKIVYVDIDNQSIDAIGRWPWPRSVMGQALEALYMFGAEKVIVDIEFIDKSELQLDIEKYEYVSQYGTTIPGQQLLEQIVMNPDRILGKSIYETGNVYLACRGVESTAKENEYDLQSIADAFFIPLRNKKLADQLIQDNAMELPVYPLYLGAKGVGYTSVEYDFDGVVRRIALFHTLGTNYLIPQLAVSALLDELGVVRSNIVIVPGQYVLLPTTNGDIRIPVDEKCNLLINWSNPFLGSFTHLPIVHFINFYNNQQYLNKYADIFDKETLTKISNENQEIISNLIKVRGKIVIIGNASTSQTDVGSLPIDPLSPLVLVYGNVLNTIYQKAFLYNVPWWMDLSLMLVFSLLILIFDRRIKSALQEVLLTIGALIFLLFAYLAAISWLGMVFNYAMTLAGIAITYIGYVVAKFIRFDKEKNFIKTAFMHYLSPEVVKQVIDNPKLLNLGGERREITAYFSDIQAFTSISEGMTPDVLVGFLNEYLTEMTDIILSVNGTVDKYEGDAIVAFFGAPLVQKDHAVRACNAVVDMQKRLTQLRAKWKSEGKPEIIVRMGINTGDAVVGNMGSQQRMDYTMMGDTVNLASRLEGANKFYGTGSMISETTYEAVKDVFLARELDTLKVIGKDQPIRVFELIDRKADASPENNNTVELFKNALELYKSQKWQAAKKIFEECDKKYSDPPSAVYMERCQEFIKNPPPANWNGVYVLKSKG
jgi:adenylate cyclase